MGRRCKFANQCHVFQGKAELKQPLFIVRNMYCNNGERWWKKCRVYEMYMKGEEVSEDFIPTEDLKP